ncbi:hypothetical protein GGU10DRAFT_282077 [Lentinula aff. detonsa]|uniref:Integral membrane protein n=1 Tax=Lentinula aff. detonsa TaxID=2804958 RepID=A0AA38NST7_9AGAR|nr:hypothetical protein GGU10DRAFT_282077 [Lentinula aff. detonsa]
MLLFWYALGALPALAVSVITIDDVLRTESTLSRRDGDYHMTHAAPLLELNETELTLHHQPIPESYYTIDFDDIEHASERHPGLMFLHATAMGFAWFVMLPIGIAMRSVNHAWHKVVTLAFYGFVALGLAFSTAYRKLTPNMYEGQVHGKQGYLWILFALALTTVDFLNIFRRIYIRFRSGQKFELRTFWDSVVLDKQDSLSGEGAEYTGLISEETEEADMAEIVSPTSLPPHKHVHYDDDAVADGPTAQWANDVRRHRRDYSHSAASETTLFGRSHSDDEELSSNRHPLQKVSLSKRIGSGVFATLERVLVFGAFAQVLTGIVVYTGGCRENYLNGCLAHLIKGAIFWCYGLVSFARYLGAFAELGWAWNRAPAAGYPSAEFVESLVIFIYGITNTWMERWGARPGDPFTTKQIQHIGIAVMFWFAGLVGMAIESKTVRQWLAASTISALNPSKRDQEAVAEPPTYIASFNPFPALVVGVTGAAMAAHAQTYLFQVQIHQLWGNLLLAWSVLRCLTYFFLWLGVPRSMLPSRPPTEALGSFFLACGGLAFMFSTEELTIAAMRRGRDDVMMFLNVAVAITCFALCWTIAVVGFKGYLKSRIAPPVAYHSSA